MSPALVDNASDPKQVKAAQKRVANRETQEREDMRAVLQNPACRRVLWRILEACEMFGTVHSSEATVMARFLGRRDPGLWLLPQLEAVEPFILHRLKQDAHRADAAEAAQADRTLAHDKEETNG